MGKVILYEYKVLLAWTELYEQLHLPYSVTSNVTAPQDAHRRLVLQVYHGS